MERKLIILDGVNCSRAIWSDGEIPTLDEIENIINRKVIYAEKSPYPECDARTTDRRVFLRNLTYPAYLVHQETGWPAEFIDQIDDSKHPGPRGEDWITCTRGVMFVKI